ncbi:LysM peptidoglycan-binding domain-containing protein [Ramlibacter pallidus]|uniref:LysM peptidoglycan-binding domain-containing protein n=1 Tax=Ramlibacter pallidus TaxID=2780087 RepID=A0ABR9S1I5_9BURK|nr:LysM peptidoglycan-binding domain-containing protein [Ramlibacter pallidus]MBE7367374.1 LysM peptidoglycan-binding domain-containing protein [Ramlibacter pallidus]
MAPSKAAFGLANRTIVAVAALVVAGGLASTASAQNYPITPAQRSTAEQVASAGVPLSELAPNAPDSYTVKSGDTLWAISGMFLKSPWRWPELWGMNMEQVRNPHRIYPGQTLYLEKLNGLARLRMGPAGAGQPTETVRVSPRTRISSLADLSLPTLPPHVIEPFLNEAILVERAEELELAPRIVAGPADRVLLTQGDRAYVRGYAGTPFVERDPSMIDTYRVFRNATPLRDPVTGKVLGYEAKYLGSAELVRNESVQPVRTSSGGTEPLLVPATVDITRAKEEIRAGDRLLAAPPRQITSYVPRAPSQPIEGTVVSVYGDAVTFVGQNQVVVINRGLADGIENGHVMAVMKAGRRIDDRTMPSERRSVQLPDERSGLLMVFRAYENLSYALVLEITDTVGVGDRISNPR